MPERTYYRILQVDPEAEIAVIEAAYRGLAKRYHPDTNKSPEAVRRMQEINEAFEVLRDPNQRQQYDEWLRMVNDSESQETENQPFDLAEYLRERGLEVIDKRPSGSLWVVPPDGMDLKPFMAELEGLGYHFQFTPRGSRSTRHRPAWWMK